MRANIYIQRQIKKRQRERGLRGRERDRERERESVCKIALPGSFV